VQSQKKIFQQTLTHAINLHKQNQFDQAEHIYKQLITNFPNEGDPFHLLGTIYHQRNRHIVAIELIKKAIKLKPKQAQFYNNLGNAFRESGAAKEAEKAFRKALKFNPKLVSAMNNLGGSVMIAGNTTSAIRIFQKTLALNTQFYPARHNLGNAYFENGENEKAITCYQHVLKTHPKHTKSARNLAESKKFTSEDEDFQLLKQLSEDASFSGADKANVLFAYAKALDDLKHHKKSFQTYIQANKTHRSTYAFSIETVANELQMVRDTISPAFFASLLKASSNCEAPVFIVGMPRSGTSLVEQILASHPKVFGAGELDFMPKSNFYMIGNKGERDFRSAFSSEGDTLVEALGSDYSRQLKELPTKRSVITDKTTHNFVYAGLLQLMLPDAKIIHCTRSPKDTCLSIFKKFFVDHQAFAYDLKELGQYYNLYLDHMAYWKSLLGDQLHEVKYENMISNQKQETETLLKFCNLDWQDACLDFHKTKRSVRTASTDQVRRPIYTSSLETWRTYEAELAPLTSMLSKSSK